MLQFGVKLVVLDNIGRSDNEFDPSRLKLPFGHTVEGMLGVNRSLIHFNRKEAMLLSVGFASPPLVWLPWLRKGGGGRWGTGGLGKSMKYEL
jgi:hypothetical protein